MLRLLRDEQISPVVARQISRRIRGIDIVAKRDWEGGHVLGASAELVLQEAHRQGFMLVTFDLRTIPPLLRLWSEHSVDHSGVILVDNRTLAQNDIGGLAAALGALWKLHAASDWLNRVIYLERR